MTTNIAINRGSEWRKWDLHFHTPSSYDYRDKSVTNQKIIDILAENKISVVAITDHHTMDIDRIQNLQQLGKDKGITVLPGIEFLADARGKDPIHFIGIFSDTSNISYIWGQLKNTTNIKQIEGSNRKHNEVYCDLIDTMKLIKELGGITTIHAGSKTNNIENITNSLPHAIAQKEDIVDLVDIYELGKVTDKEGYIKNVFPNIGKYIPMIIASDNHDIKNYSLKENCWIKADPTFEGLKQIIYEPEERVRIQEEEPDFKEN
ncbi:PHP domain-containing protein, partial [Capnocytophaga leadbetteri]